MASREATNNETENVCPPIQEGELEQSQTLLDLMVGVATKRVSFTREEQILHFDSQVFDPMEA